MPDAALSELASDGADGALQPGIAGGAQPGQSNGQPDILAALHELEMFSQSLSHDLRAPLRAIRGYAAILVNDHGDTLPPEARELVVRMAAAAGRVDALAEGLLALAKTGRAAVRRGEARLSEIAEVIVAELRHVDPARDVVTEIEPGIVAIADAVLVGDVLQNLLGNAWKYTSKKNRARITFRCCAIEPERVYAVSDDGAGFDMAFADRLFRSFERLHAASQFAGTGLGLATAKRIIELHNGRIWAESRVGQGATFYFTLGETSGEAIVALDSPAGF
jgi:light-regulated signal transduction histidine kinase (bacteriophytochrome)